MPKKHNHQSLRTLQRRRLYSATPCIALRNMLTQQTLEERQPTFAAIVFFDYFACFFSRKNVHCIHLN
jgi:hypothetical protein